MNKLKSLTRKESQIPSFEQTVKIFRTYFFNREDKILTGTNGNYSCKTLNDEQELLNWLEKHFCESAIVGAYTPGYGNLTKWLCMDIDGAGHSGDHALSNPGEVLKAIQQQCDLYSIPCHIERSKGAQGYHVWIFFDKPVLASEARSLGLLLAQQPVLLENGQWADASKNKGIEVFPKQREIKENGTGNGVWLPWAHSAKPSGSLFYRLNEAGNVHLIEEPIYEFDTCACEIVRNLLSSLAVEVEEPHNEPVNEPESPNLATGQNASSHPSHVLTSGNELFTADEKSQIADFLHPLKLERIYGNFLTGKKSGEGWLESHDPFGVGEDHNPSAAVADGTGQEIKGFFYSHRPDGKRLHIWNAMVEMKLAVNKQDALEQISRWTQKPIPQCLSTEADNQRILEQKVQEYNREFAAVMYGSTFQVLREHTNHKGEVSQSFLDIKDFKSLKMNDWMTIGEKGKTKEISLPDYWLKSPKRRELKGVIFDPNTQNPDYYNLWKGLSIQPDSQKKCDRLLEHIWENVCQAKQAEYDYLLTWLAYGVQKPGERPQTAIVIRGKKGTGKGTLVHAYGSFFGPHFCYTNDMNQVIGRFNALTLNSLVINADEAYWPGLKDMEGRLKGLITDPYRVIEQKGKDSIQIDNYVRLIITANEDWIVPCSSDERRFFVLEMGDNHMQDHSYFEKINEELESGGRKAFLHYLLQYDISQVNLRSIPQTEALLKQKELSANPVQKFWKEILLEGQLLPTHEGWENTVAKDDLYHYFVEKVKSSGIEKSNWQAQFSAKLNEICPHIATQKKTVQQYDPQSGCAMNKRRWCYVFPPLDVCRKEYERIMKHSIQWPSLEEEETLAFNSFEEEFEDEFVKL